MRIFTLVPGWIDWLMMVPSGTVVLYSSVAVPSSRLAADSALVASPSDRPVMVGTSRSVSILGWAMYRITVSVRVTVFMAAELSRSGRMLMFSPTSFIFCWALSRVRVSTLGTSTYSTPLLTFRVTVWPCLTSLGGRGVCS